MMPQVPGYYHFQNFLQILKILTFFRLADDAGVDMILVGDSMGMVVLGQKNTVGVTMDDVWISLFFFCSFGSLTFSF
jgi:hypothetical protein